jgi:hypothetical protein
VLRVLLFKRVRSFISINFFFLITCGRIARVLRLLLLERLHRTLCLCSSSSLTLQNGAARALKQLTEVVEQPEERACASVSVSVRQCVSVSVRQCVSASVPEQW